MSDGHGCRCAAHDKSECACGADWTPKELYELRRELAEANTTLELYKAANDDVRRIAKERDEAIKALSDWKEFDDFRAKMFAEISGAKCKTLGELHEYVIRLKSERDEANRLVRIYGNEAREAVVAYETALKERDEAMSCVNALSKQADEEERAKELNAALVDRYRAERDEAREYIRARPPTQYYDIATSGPHRLDCVCDECKLWRKVAGLEEPTP